VPFTAWYLTIGGLLVVMALAATVLKRLPLSASMFYLVVGAALAPAGAGLVRLDILRDAHLLERLTEVALIVSLFTAGLKLRLPLSDRRWRPPILLASAGMVVTVAGVAAFGVYALGLSLGAAVLLGGVLAPTDPVLASDVQVEHAGDKEDVRFALTGEAGLNDGTAFPFIMLGLGLLDAGGFGAFAARWLAIDVVWAIAAGLGVGTACGSLVGRLVLYLRREHREAVGLDDFLALGLIALSYGLALAVHSYGFLAVFAAGLALRRVERQHSAERAPADVEGAAQGTDDPATDRERAPAAMAQAVLAFNEQLERIGEVAIVLVIGVLLTGVTWTALPLWFIPVLLLLIRPLAIFLSLPGTRTTTRQRGLIAWFGVKGIGSIYYLAYALTHGLPAGEGRVLGELTLAVVAASIVAHGISVTPLMQWYQRRGARPSAVGA
jgi:NhaP-type Na+/H+ or K+/H+ antiporter